MTNNFINVFQLKLLDDYYLIVWLLLFLDYLLEWSLLLWSSLALCCLSNWQQVQQGGAKEDKSVKGTVSNT